QADSTLELLTRVQQNEPERPTKVNPAIDRDLETICLKCLEKEPARRYPTAEALAEDLECWLAGEPIQARPAKAWERAAKWTRRNPVVASLAAAALFILLAGLAGIVSQWYRATANATRAANNAAKADANARQSNRRLVHSYVANGNRLVAEGDPFAAMLWF